MNVYGHSSTTSWVPSSSTIVRRKQFSLQSVFSNTLHLKTKQKDWFKSLQVYVYLFLGWTVPLNHFLARQLSSCANVLSCPSQRFVSKWKENKWLSLFSTKHSDRTFKTMSSWLRNAYNLNNINIIFLDTLIVLEMLHRKKNSDVHWMLYLH